MFNLKEQKGSMLILVLVMSGLFLVVAIGALSLGALELKLNSQKVARAQSLAVAEAGANYYRWALYHNPTEYCNKQTCIGAPDYGPYGPFVYTDSAGKNIQGYYELYLTPPTNGSSIVKIKSVGWTADHPEIKRTVEVRCGIPSWASYSTLCNEDIRFGAGTEVWGKVHSNKGIRFDGVANNLVSSSILEYNDPDHSGTSLEYGVHTHVYSSEGASGDVYDLNEISDGTNPPSPLEHPAVFKAGRSFPIPIVSFDLLNNYASSTLVLAESNGLVYESSKTIGKKSSSNQGYRVVLKTNNAMDIHIVKSVEGNCGSESPTEEIISDILYEENVPFPANGIIFFKDKVWVEGKISNSRITILAFIEPFTGSTADIVINNDLTYTNYDGRDAIGLVAQGDITVGLPSDNNLEIDAALIAKEGRIGRYFYGSYCGSEYKRNMITIRGALATRKRYGFSWTTDGVYSSGYSIRNLIYDNNVTFMPPPYFPTTGEYTFLSWKEY